MLEADRVPLTVLSSWEKFLRWESSRNLKTSRVQYFQFVIMLLFYLLLYLSEVLISGKNTSEKLKLELMIKI